MTEKEVKAFIALLNDSALNDSADSWGGEPKKEDWREPSFYRGQAFQARATAKDLGDILENNAHWFRTYMLNKE